MNTVCGVEAKCDIPSGSHVKVAPDFTVSNYPDVTVIGLQFSGNANFRSILNVMGTVLLFPATIEMPCGWSVIIPTLDDCNVDLMCPCGDSQHYIIRWMKE